MEGTRSKDLASGPADLWFGAQQIYREAGGSVRVSWKKKGLYLEVLSRERE